MVLGALLETLVGLPGELLSTSIELSLSLLVCIAFLFATMSIIALLIILVSLILASLYKISLEKPKVDAVDQVLGPNCSVVYAHRAGALDAPENTLAAIRLAKTNKAFGVELDLSFTKDGVAIAFHDDDLERTTDGRGALCDHTWDEVSALDASINHIYHDRFQKERVPKMDDAIHEALRLGLHIIIDIKAYDKQVVTYLVSLFDRTPELYEKALVASFFPQVIYSLRSERPKMVAALIWRPFYLSHKNTEATKPRFRDSPLRQWAAELLDPLLGLAIHKFLWHVTGCSAVLIVKDCICPHYLRQWRDRDIRVLSWTPNNPVEKDYLISLGALLYFSPILRL
ncbi:glycerophosphodiester phosphodiesterase 1-like isoform X1 [Varroa jacobsoni]|uniref:glycerophosphodiester phosphodiesterase 1-like isoform X1 n=1 Tax=Varroa jacobsoni TaxID=62625 RepID=UPI000BF3995E|nr:glycerophosphodiester phosphodiesterase 1-like isoform X1 [Varroa jacobsoni]XP_022689736.1 glycerophosphodiester phosphodiesterase 1-like isoform X1 [Varroa jacobsoni]XP_022689737.1 glycerophosphodiester phosphodiesterase 1-like isoform X1 [Varroa jacobsoni]XP_022689738.1 glycerophosphodiester phosphodiesterase 1-like isoform X1 [Varroa jacobsoni]